MGKSVPDEPPPLDPDTRGLFLDYDGTLVGIAPTPAEAAPTRRRWRCWRSCSSGSAVLWPSSPAARWPTSIGFLTPLRLTVAGLHGLDLRPRWRCRRGSHRRDPAAGAARFGVRGVRRPGARNPGGGQAFERRLALSAGARRPLAAEQLADRAWWRRVRGHCGYSGARWWSSCCRPGRDKGTAHRRRLPHGAVCRAPARCSSATT